MNVYLACGLTHVPRDVFPEYVALLHGLAAGLRRSSDITTVRYALMDSDPQLAEYPEADRARLCYEWDRILVEAAAVVVAEASFPSTGLGIELQIAAAHGIPVVLCRGDYGANRAAGIRYTNPDERSHQLQIGDGHISLMALGLPNVIAVVGYVDLRDCLDQVAAALGRARQLALSTVNVDDREGTPG